MTDEGKELLAGCGAICFASTMIGTLAYYWNDIFSNILRGPEFFLVVACGITIIVVAFMLFVIVCELLI